MSGGAMKRYTSRGVVLSTLKYGDKAATATDEKFFGSWNLFKKGIYKEIRRKAL